MFTEETSIEPVLRGLYAVRCVTCGEFTQAKGPRPVKQPRCWKHKKWPGRRYSTVA